jgi:hypothetical protein
MTSVFPSNAAAAAFAAGINQGLQAAALQLAGGVLARFMNPLNAGPLAFAQMPPNFLVGVGCCGQPPQAQWTAEMGTSGRASIDLGDGYTLQLNERNSEIVIENASTGETTRIWGDPHVDVDGQRVFDFWGTTTFTLGNGTKLTINTEQWGGNPNAYVASQVVITRGDQALTIDGISQNRLGDLSVTMGNNGRALDAATRDGYTLHENMAGSSWLTTRGTMATQRDLDATRVGAEFGPGSAAMSLSELSVALGQWLTLGALLNMGAGLTAEAYGAR